MSVGTWFKKFHNNIYMDSDTVATVKKRYETITKRINLEYWRINSKVEKSLYVGSYGRGTEIFTSDIDIVIRLPWAEKERFDNRVGNVQSQLLTEIKEKLQKSYSNSDLSSDGQIIVISFSDGIRYEIVPAFKYNDGRYCYPDTNRGGSWEIMDPSKEMKFFNLRHQMHNYTMKKFCRMVRSWKDTNNIKISGELIDSIVYSYYHSTAKYTQENPYIYFDWISRDFFKYLSENVHKTWYTPGTYRSLCIKYPYTTAEDANNAYKKTLEAIDDETKYPLSAKIKWREIYGDKFAR